MAVQPRRPPSTSAIPQDMLDRLAKRGSARSFPRNTVLIHEGDETTSLFVIVSGRVRVFLSDDDGREITLGTQGAGEYFGELALDGGPRSASIITLEPTQCLVVRHEELEQLIAENPAFSLHLLRDLMRRTRRL